MRRRRRKNKKKKKIETKRMLGSELGGLLGTGWCFTPK